MLNKFSYVRTKKGSHNEIAQGEKFYSIQKKRRSITLICLSETAATESMIILRVVYHSVISQALYESCLSNPIGVNTGVCLFCYTIAYQKPMFLVNFMSICILTLAKPDTLRINAS